MRVITTVPTPSIGSLWPPATVMVPDLGAREEKSYEWPDIWREALVSKTQFDVGDSGSYTAQASTTSSSSHSSRFLDRAESTLLIVKAVARSPSESRVSIIIVFLALVLVLCYFLLFY